MSNQYDISIQIFTSEGELCIPFRGYPRGIAVTNNNTIVCLLMIHLNSINIEIANSLIFLNFFLSTCYFFICECKLKYFIILIFECTLALDRECNYFGEFVL